ncbi:MAG: hypothetical protein AB7S93_26495, partial [Xanthobacteraceae bacterium]
PIYVTWGHQQELSRTRVYWQYQRRSFNELVHLTLSTKRLRDRFVGPADEVPAEVNYFLADRTFLQKGRMMSFAPNWGSGSHGIERSL